MGFYLNKILARQTFVVVLLVSVSADGRMSEKYESLSSSVADAEDTAAADEPQIKEDLEDEQQQQREEAKAEQENTKKKKTNRNPFKFFTKLGSLVPRSSYRTVEEDDEAPQSRKSTKAVVADGEDVTK